MWIKIIPFEYLGVFSVGMFFIPPIVSLAMFYILKRELIWLSILITVIVDVIVFRDVLTYYETRSLALLFLIPQVFVVAVISLYLTYKKRQRK